jgi:hypothetical protein
LLSSETLSIIQETTNIEKNTIEKQRLDLISHQDQQRFARSTVRVDAFEKARNQNAFYGADAGDISHFTSLVEKVLSPEV